MNKFDSQKAPGTLEMREGIAYIVRQCMIDYCNDVLDDMEIYLAEIPAVIKTHFGEQAGPYLEEETQRAILNEGFATIEEKCLNISLDFYRNSPILPAARRKAALANVDAIPGRDTLKGKIDDAADGITGCIRELPFEFDLKALQFEDGKLKVPYEVRERLRPMYTTEVEATTLETVQIIHRAAEVIAELQRAKVDTLGIVKSMARGMSYTDGELVSWLQLKTPLPR